MTTPRLISTWAELATVEDSYSHRLEIDIEGCNGWIVKKDDPPDRLGIYLSTHTFYGSTYAASTARLRRCGFDVTIANWDAEA